jgi:hypothetical protein
MAVNTLAADMVMGHPLLVMVPTRGRPLQCLRLLKSWEETSQASDLLFISDPDDDSYEGFDWRGASHAVLEPRLRLVGKLNVTAAANLDYPALMFVGDDHVFRTPGWDQKMLAALKRMGGSGMLYPDDKRRNDVPEICMISSDIVRALGWFANPAMTHYYIDNSWADVGNGAQCLRWVPQAVVEHLHYSVHAETKHDATYKEAEDFGPADHDAYMRWRGADMHNDIAAVRKLLGREDKTRSWLLGV